MSRTSRQQGIVGLGWLVLIALIGGLVLVGFKLIPLYYDDRIVDKVLKDIANDPDNGRLTGQQLWSLIDFRLTNNSVYSITPQQFTYTRKDGRKTVAINYESRVHLIGNLDLLATFARSAVLRNPE